MIIYKTINKINDKIYIGQDQYNNPLYLGSGLLLERDIQKHGTENFSKEIIEYCETKNQLNEREIFWINKLKSQDVKIGYNIANGGSGGDTISHHPKRKEFCDFLSKRNKEYYKDKNKHPLYGKNQSQESNEKIIQPMGKNGFAINN